MTIQNIIMRIFGVGPFFKRKNKLYGKKIKIYHVGSIFYNDSYFDIRSTPAPSYRVKDSGHSAKSAGDRLQLNMHEP